MKISLSISPVLYHLTNYSAAASIAEKNRFELKPSDGTDAEVSLGGGTYYMSTARHKFAAYTRKGIYETSVIFVLDGMELATKYKAKPVDYWSGMYEQEGGDRANMESEDRIYSNTAFIAPASRYILEIHCHINDRRNQLLKIKRFALKNKIGIWFYQDTKSMLLLNKAKAVSFDFTTMEPERVRGPSEYTFKYKKRQNAITGWLQLYDIPVNGTDWRTQDKYLTEESKFRLKQLRNNYNGEPARQLSAGMHNEKTTDYGDYTRGREDLDRLIKLLRKNKWTVQNFVDVLYAKWYPPET